MLNMTVEEALHFFENVPSIRRKMETLYDAVSYTHLDVYKRQTEIIEDCLDAIESFMEEVMSKRRKDKYYDYSDMDCLLYTSRCV